MKLCLVQNRYCGMRSIKGSYILESYESEKTH